MTELALKVENLKKQYRLGVIGGGTLYGDLQSWWAKVRGKEDPNTKIGTAVDTKKGSFYALKGINFEVKKGERLGIIGGNGAGKSTTLKILSRVTAPTEGTVYINGRISSMLEVGTGFHAELTGRENIYLNGAILGMSKAEVDEKIEDIIEFSECRQFIDTPVKRYSSGMYVKLAFAVAAHLDSEILIMDEVLAVGDMAFQKKCLKKMKDVAENDGKTVLYVSHNMSTIRQLCNRCIVLSKGEIIYDGDVEEAIHIYLGNNMMELPVDYNLENEVRPSAFHGKNIKINEFKFENKEMACFQRGEVMRFSLSFQVFKGIEDIKMYFIIRNEFGENVGTTQTMSKIVDGEKDKQYKAFFEMDISNLAPGKYWFRPDLFSMDEHGNALSYDQAMRSVFFEVLENENIGLPWRKQFFGNIRLNPLECTAVKEEIK